MEFGLYIFAIVIVLFAQGAVQGSYRKYRQIAAHCNLSGFEVARRILDDNGLHDVMVEMNPRGGTLSDHYDPRSKVVRLSPEVYQHASIASIAVAAHECGHALQHANSYAGIAIRNAILPFALVSNNLAWAAIFIGFLSGYQLFIGIGLLALTMIALFQLATLPVELDASKRALAILGNGFLVEDEVSGARKMLSAAAFTYIAALISSLANLLRIFMISRRD